MRHTIPQLNKCRKKYRSKKAKEEKRNVRFSFDDGNNGRGRGGGKGGGQRYGRGSRGRGRGRGRGGSGNGRGSRSDICYKKGQCKSWQNGSCSYQHPNIDHYICATCKGKGHPSYQCPLNKQGGNRNYYNPNQNPNHNPVQPHQKQMHYMNNAPPQYYGAHNNNAQHWNMNAGYGFGGGNNNNNNNNNSAQHREFMQNEFIGQQNAPQTIGQAQMLLQGLNAKKKALARGQKAVKGYLSETQKRFGNQ